MTDLFARLPAFDVGTLIVGLLVGLAYFTALRRTADLLAGEGNDRLGAGALTLGRLVGIATFFTLMAALGRLPLIMSFLGFIIARTIMIRRVPRAG